MHSHLHSSVGRPADGSLPVRVGHSNTSTLQPCNQDDLELVCRDNRFRRSLVEFPIADTPLERQFKAPPMVRDIDWFHQLNPTGLLNPNTFACIQGMASYRDFRMSPWGTSSWISIGRGLSLTVFLIPPSPDNLAHFAGNEKHHASRFTLLFLGNGMHGCHRVEMRPNDTLFIPPGWMWASNVLHDDTSSATCVIFSGFFLHGFTLPAQLHLLQYHQLLATHTEYATDWPLVATVAEFSDQAIDTLGHVLKFWIWPAMYMYSRRVKKQRSMSPWENCGLFQAIAQLRDMTAASVGTAPPLEGASCGWFTGLTAATVGPILDALEADLRLKQSSSSRRPQEPTTSATTFAAKAQTPPPHPPRLSQQAAAQFLNAFVADSTTSRASVALSTSRSDSSLSPRSRNRRGVAISSNSFLTPPRGQRAAACAKCQDKQCKCNPMRRGDGGDDDDAVCKISCQECKKPACTCSTQKTQKSKAPHTTTATLKGPNTPSTMRTSSSRQPTDSAAAPPPDFDEWMASLPLRLPTKLRSRSASSHKSSESVAPIQRKKAPRALPLPMPPDDLDLWETSQPVELPPKPTTRHSSATPPTHATRTSSRFFAAKTPSPLPKSTARASPPIVEIDDDDGWFDTTEPIPVLPPKTPHNASSRRSDAAMPIDSSSSEQDDDQPRSTPTTLSTCACPASFQRCTSCFNCIKFDCTCPAQCGCSLPKCPVCQNCFATHCSCGPASHTTTALTLLARRDNELRFIQAVQDRTVKLFNRSRHDVHETLRALNFDPHEGDFEYLLSLPVSRFMQAAPPHRQHYTKGSIARSTGKSTGRKRSHDVVERTPPERPDRTRPRS
ncbi:hypothetical protein, variant [Aphanomyces invadans]|uniref:JmjC domain-containing protein n=1 Tax=Aphanomyces invadans TaxID=157072 RepID=A0A024UMV9_9STRA|nr:hypothetical protein, variant [Aphanomyces invadans]ETW07791.1 hypothetical protein, variant [Aphanomyces invadans]|eukprot:XP_008863884.1 hypothetical protein, variant [Aphanomyces invadans]